MKNNKDNKVSNSYIYENNYMNSSEYIEDNKKLRNKETSIFLDAPLFYKLPNNADIFSQAIIEYQKIENSYVKKSTLKLLLTFQKTILNILKQIDFSGHLPPLILQFLEDNSVLVEWIFKDFRIGFVIESDVAKSSWYLVSNSNLEEASASGILNLDNCELILQRIIEFVLLNV